MTENLHFKELFPKFAPDKQYADDCRLHLSSFIS